MRNHSETLTGVSKEEYDTALPHIEGLVDLNYNEAYAAVLKVDANGHAYKDGNNNYSNCNVSITNPGGQLV